MFCKYEIAIIGKIITLKPVICIIVPVADVVLLGIHVSIFQELFTLFIHTSLFVNRIARSFKCARIYICIYL